MSQPHPPRLSFCIATFNRASFLAQTLETLIAQATDECEIVVSDNASTDNTEQVVSEYARRFVRLRYFKQDSNKGLDCNFDRAVELATGEYCWLMADDDLLKPGAVAHVIDALRQDLSLVIVNIEIRTADMSKVVRRRWINIKSDRLYAPTEMDQLVVDLDYTLMNIGNLIVRRMIWLSRDRERYYGSLFIHVGVVFQQPLPGQALVIAEPLVDYRSGNAQSFSSMWPEILLSKWPSVVDSLALSDSARMKVESGKPRWGIRWMLFLRMKDYSLAEYQRWIRPRLSSMRDRFPALVIALLPRTLAASIEVPWAFVSRNLERFLYSIAQSRFRPRQLAHRSLSFQGKTWRSRRAKHSATDD